jgi:hypothetical protein
MRLAPTVEVGDETSALARQGSAGDDDTQMRAQQRPGNAVLPERAEGGDVGRAAFGDSRRTHREHEDPTCAPRSECLREKLVV